VIRVASRVIVDPSSKFSSECRKIMKELTPEIRYKLGPYSILESTILMEFGSHEN